MRLSVPRTAEQLSLINNNVQYKACFSYHLKDAGVFAYIASKALNHIIHSGDSGTNKVHVRWGRRVFGLFGWKSKDLVSVMFDVEMKDSDSQGAILSSHTSAPTLFFLCSCFGGRRMIQICLLIQSVMYFIQKQVSFCFCFWSFIFSLHQCWVLCVTK